MITPEQLIDLKNQYGHIFEIEENGNLTLKDHFGIPPFKMIFVEGGEFVMGEDPIGGIPVHEVKLSSFYMAEFPVTQEFYRTVAGENPSKFEGINHPVEQVSWYNAVEFCETLNKKLGILSGPYSIYKQKTDKNDLNEDKFDKSEWNINFNLKQAGFRLPTKAEWEFSAKGGNSKVKATLYSGSNHLEDVGWHFENSGGETKPVGLKFPNSIGIFDMSGNVWEWCWDSFDNSGGKTLENTDGFRSDSFRRAVCGGSWRTTFVNCQLVSPLIFQPFVTYNDNGFRLVFVV